jgi:hypothetical protein
MEAYRKADQAAVAAFHGFPKETAKPGARSKARKGKTPARSPTAKP